MQRRKFLRVAGGTTGVGLIAGCAGNDGNGGGNGGGGDGADGTAGDDGGGGGEAITIGALEPLSGNFSAWGQAHRQGLEYAINGINQDGGVLGGRNIELAIEDTGSDPTEADSIFRRLVEQENAVATAGPVSSDVGIRARRTAQDVEVPLMLHMAGSDEVLTRDTRYTFRIGLVPAPTMMEAQAQLIEDAGYERVGAIVGDYAWGRAVEQGIQENISADVNVQVAPVGADDFKPFIRQMSSDLEMMIATGHPPGSITIASQMYQLGRQPEVVTGPGIPPQVIRDALGQDASKGFTHIHMTDVYTDAFAELAGQFADDTGNRMDTHAGYGYVTGELLAQAIEDAGEAEPTAVADAIRNIQFETLFANPIEYTEWGELKNQRQIYSTLELEPPDYYPDGNYNLVEEFRTDPLEPFEPSG